MNQFKIALVSQQSLLRHALACLLLSGSWPGIIEEYNCADDVLSRGIADSVIIVADAELPEPELRELGSCARKSGQKIVFIGSRYYEKRLLGLMKLKADGYLTLDSTVEDLMLKLHKIGLGFPVIDDHLIPAMVDKLSGNDEECVCQSKYNSLTPREKEVLNLLAAGFSNRQIADKLVISLNTVKNHVHNVLEKLMIENRTQLVSYAYTTGLVS